MPRSHRRGTGAVVRGPLRGRVRASGSAHGRVVQADGLAGYRAPDGESAHPRVGIPRTLLFYELFPYWHRLLAELGADVVLSDPTNPRTVRDTQAHTPAETCFPVKLMQGHVLNLVEKGVDWVFLPSVVSREAAPGQENSTLCPFIQSVPHLVMANLDLAARGVGALSGPIYLDETRTLPNEARRARMRLSTSHPCWLGDRAGRQLGPRQLAE